MTNTSINGNKTLSLEELENAVVVSFNPELDFNQEITEDGKKRSDQNWKYWDIADENKPYIFHLVAVETGTRRIHGSWEVDPDGWAERSDPPRENGEDAWRCIPVVEVDPEHNRNFRGHLDKTYTGRPPQTIEYSPGVIERKVGRSWQEKYGDR